MLCEHAERRFLCDDCAVADYLRLIEAAVYVQVE